MSSPDCTLQVFRRRDNLGLVLERKRKEGGQRKSFGAKERDRKDSPDCRETDHGAKLRNGSNEEESKIVPEPSKSPTRGLCWHSHLSGSV